MTRMRTKGGRLRATSVGDGETSLDLFHDPGELVLELRGWRVASSEGCSGGRRDTELDRHRVRLDRAA